MQPDLLAVRPQHAAQAERQHCQVAELALAGARWPQVEAGTRVVFGRLRALGAARNRSGGSGGSCVEPAEYVQAGCAKGPQRKRRRTEADPAVVSSAPFALRPYFCHLPVNVGRCVWCLNCFEVPGRRYQAWKQGRCGGTKPTYARPPGLCATVLSACRTGRSCRRPCKVAGPCLSVHVG